MKKERKQSHHRVFGAYIPQERILVSKVFFFFWVCFVVVCFGFKPDKEEQLMRVRGLVTFWPLRGRIPHPCPSQAHGSSTGVTWAGFTTAPFQGPGGQPRQHAECLGQQKAAKIRRDKTRVSSPCRGLQIPLRTPSERGPPETWSSPGNCEQGQLQGDRTESS